MKVEGLEAFDSSGNFTLPLTIQIHRYHKEAGMSIVDIIETMKHSGATFQDWCHWSLNGYGSFKLMMAKLLPSKADST